MDQARAVRVAELAILGKKAEAGAFAVPFWQKATLLGLSVASLSLQAYQARKHP